MKHCLPSACDCLIVTKSLDYNVAKIKYAMGNIVCHSAIEANGIIVTCFLNVTLEIRLSH